MKIFRYGSLIMTFTLSGFAFSAHNKVQGSAKSGFTVEGVSENSFGEAEGSMFSQAHSACYLSGHANKLSSTRFRVTYTYYRASSEFECIDQTSNGTDVSPDWSQGDGPSRCCWYFDDSNPCCRQGQ